MANKLIEVKGLSYSYPGQQDINHAVSVCDFSVFAGESVAIVGASGSGKSTLLGLLGGLLRPSDGTYKFRETLLPAQDMAKMAVFRREHVGFIFQNFCLLPQLNVLDNVLLPSRIAQTSGDGEASRATALLDHLGLSELRSRFPNQLSGGQMQRVAIARALIKRPSIILADEPTGNLDSENAASITECLLTHIGEQSCLVVVTHSAELASKMSRTTRMADASLFG